MALPPIISAIFRVAAVSAPIVGRALIDAYRQAMINAAANGAKAGSSMRAARMSMDEAAKILNVKLPAKPEEIAERSSTIYESNDPTKGGSQYIRDKVDIARKVLFEKFPPSETPAEAPKEAPKE